MPLNWAIENYSDGKCYIMHILPQEEEKSMQCGRGGVGGRCWVKGRVAASHSSTLTVTTPLSHGPCGMQGRLGCTVALASFPCLVRVSPFEICLKGGRCPRHGKACER